MIAVMASLTFVPPTHCIPDNNRFVPVAMYEVPPVAALTLAVSNLNAQKGEQVCVTVTAKNFEQIISMQYSMKWDEKVLKFKELKSFGLPGLNQNNFSAHLAAKGTLTYSWYDPHLKGATKPDGATLYELCFEIVGEPGAKSQFEFNSLPTVVEIANSSGVFLELKTEGGMVEVN